VILWEFRTRRKVRAAFLRIYGPHGAWVRLFRRAPGYVGTRLFSDPADSLRFFTLDVWQSAAAFRSAKRRMRKAYAALDLACEELTVREKQLGAFKL